MKLNKISLCSLSALAIIAAHNAAAEELVTAPSLEGGWTAMIGTMYMVPSVNNTTYNTISDFPGIIINPDKSKPLANATTNSTINNQNQNFEGDYAFGIQAEIGYVFDETANGVELSYRNFDSDSSGSIDAFSRELLDLVLPGPTFVFLGVGSDGFETNQDNRYENFDLMFSQFLDIGDYVQMRFLGGVSYLSELEQTTTANGNFGASLFIQNRDGISHLNSFSEIAAESKSTYDGLGPRVGMDGRFDFGDELQGFGIVGGASAAYLLGSLETNYALNTESELLICMPHTPCQDLNAPLGAEAYDKRDNHAVTNLRANLGIDYVFYVEEHDLPTFGLELGYEVDTYFDGVSQISPIGGDVQTSDITFSGPYLNVKGVF